MEEVSEETVDSKSALVEIHEGGKTGQVGFEIFVEVVKVNIIEVMGGRLVSPWDGEVYDHGDG